MGIAYPHQVRVWRNAESDGSVEDAYGRTVPGAPAIVATVPAWIQHATEQEATRLDEAGAVRTAYLVFMPVPSVGLSQSDALETLAGGGQIDGVVHQIDAIEDPDGTGHHLEVLTTVVRSVEEALQAPAAVSS